MLKFFLYILTILISCQGLTQDAFDRGLKEANNKNYSEAIKAFEQVITEEVGNTSAYFNLGICYMELHHYGKAIWAFERVLKYSSGDIEAPASIEHCYSKLGEDIPWNPHISGLQSLIFRVGSNTWAYLSIVFSVLLALTIVFFFKTNETSRRRLLAIFGIGQMIVVIACTIAASSSANYLTDDRFALITEKSIPTFLNDQGELSQLQLKEGMKVELVKGKSEKQEVLLPDGRSVLVNKEDLDVI